MSHVASLTPEQRKERAETGRAKQAELENARKVQREERDLAVANYGLKFWHRQPYTCPVLGFIPGITVAYAVNRHVITLSTALCAPADDFTRAEGEFQAAMNFRYHEFIRVRMPRPFEGRAREWIALMFGDVSQERDARPPIKISLTKVH